MNIRKVYFIDFLRFATVEKNPDKNTLNQDVIKISISAKTILDKSKQPTVYAEIGA